ncbi:MAG TPA: alpha/beta hydrolase-fold protein [Flavobacterium sp.]|jgi:hypothetical protein
MKNCIALIALLFSVSLFSQKITDTIHSAKLGEDREITIGLPASYKKITTKKYPLLVLLDGDYLFDPFQGALNYGTYWDDLPEMIIVGISQNKNGERDSDSSYDSQTGLPQEKGEKFFEFIGEVVAAMEKNYRIAPFKIIAGHDVTAGFLNFYLYKDAPLFNAFISMSPELPTGMEEQLPERFNLIQQPVFYYHSTADGDVKKMQKRIKALDESVKTIKKPGFNYKFDEFKGASHYSLVLHSIPNALYHFFSVYQPISSAEFNEKIAPLPSGYVEYLVAKYDAVEKALGMKMPIRLSDFKAIEAAILKNKAYNEFDMLSDLAKKSYPKSMLSDYHLAMMYEKTGDIKRAAKTYQSAFQKEEIGDLTKDMMLNKADELKKM